jgi:hypothetical protein
MRKGTKAKKNYERFGGGGSKRVRNSDQDNASSRSSLLYFNDTLRGRGEKQKSEGKDRNEELHNSYSSPNIIKMLKTKM